MSRCWDDLKSLKEREREGRCIYPYSVGDLMPLLICDASEAWNNLRVNKQSGWPAKRRGGERLYPVAQPNFSSDFRLHQGDSVFTIGSCFARNIEEALVDAGLDVISSRYAVPESEWQGRANGILNKYHPFAMLNELTWALSDNHPYPFDKGILEVGPDQWVDIHLPGSAKPVSYVRATERRREMIALYRQIRQCNLVILTPGLVEAWWDKEVGYYTNQTISRALMQRHPGRFELHQLSYHEVYEAMSSIVSLLMEQCNDGLRIFFTVSPVPLAATFTKQDVLVANTYAKSVLRAAVEQIVVEHPANVGYFPSYEAITLSDRNEVFGDDYIHVKDEAVRSNIMKFVSSLNTDLTVPIESRSRNAPPPPVKPVRGMVAPQIQGGIISGWAVRADSDQPARVKVLINGNEVAECDCVEMRKALLERSAHSTGYCGFSFTIGALLKGGEEIQVQDAATGQHLHNSPFIHRT